MPQLNEKVRYTMLNRRSTLLILIAELTLLALLVTFNLLEPVQLSNPAETFAFMLTLVNLGLFNTVVIQRTMDYLTTLVFIQFVLVSMYAVGQMLTTTSGVALGVIALVTCC